MNGISNGDGTYRQLSNSDALVGMASDLPNPNASITENIKNNLIKSYKYEFAMIPCKTAWGNWYITTELTIGLPFDISNAKSVQVTYDSSGQGSAIVLVNALGSTSLRCYLCRGNATEGIKGYIHITAFY